MAERITGDPRPIPSTEPIEPQTPTGAPEPATTKSPAPLSADEHSSGGVARATQVVASAPERLATGPAAPPPHGVGQWNELGEGLALDRRDGMPLLEGARPESWAAAADAYYRLAATIDLPRRRNPIAKLNRGKRAAVLDTVAAMIANDAFASSAGDALSTERHVQLRQSLARVLCGVIDGLNDKRRLGRADQAQLERALTLAADLAAAEPFEPLRRAMVSGLYNQHYRLPEDLRPISERFMGDYVPVWAYDGDPSRPGGVQPIPIGHFELDEEGGIVALCGPRVRIELPEEIGTELSGFSLEPSATMPSPLPDSIAPNVPHGGFVFPPDSPLTAVVTAFCAATRVIENADAWAGHPVGWGNDGQLVVVPYTFVTDFFNAYYDGAERTLHLGALGTVDAEEGLKGFTGKPSGWAIPVKDLFLDGAGSPDIVAHEAGHASLGGIKPGLFYGMSAALNEAVADVTALLVAFDDPEVVARILRETGGDLSQENEASRIAEVVGSALHRYSDDDPSNDNDRFLRTMHSPLVLEDCGIERDATTLGSGFFLPPEKDPHHVSQVLSGIAYDGFMTIYERELANGHTYEHAVDMAQRAVGTLMMRSMRYIPEHAVSFRDYALALVRAQKEIYGERYLGDLVALLAERQLLDPGEDLDAALAAQVAGLPAFRLSPAVTEPTEILAQLEGMEAAQLAKVEGMEREAREAVVLLRHKAGYSISEQIGAEELAVFQDVTAEDGVRVVRLVYKFEPPSMGSTFDYRGDDDAADDDARKVTAYVSLVFDPSGRLVALWNDRPEL